MATYTLTGITGSSAILTGQVRTGGPRVVDDPVLQAGAQLLGTLRRPLSIISGEIAVAALVEGGLPLSIPPLIAPTAELDSAFDLFWTSHDPTIGAPLLDGFVRRSDSGTHKIVFGDAVVTAVLEGALTLNASIAGDVVVTPTLFQTYVAIDSALLTVAPSLLGEPAPLGAQRSPPMVLFDGTNFLQRSASDSALNPSASFTVSVTFDPELILQGVSSVLASKNNETDTQAGWKMEWDASTGLVTFTVFGAADGSISRVRPTATAIRTRARVTAAVSSGGDITLYLDGVQDQGSQVDSGSFTAPNASTEPFALGAEEPSNGGANVFRGAIYDFAFWDTELGAPQATQLLPDGFVKDVGSANLQVYYDSSAIVADPVNGELSGWVDTSAGLPLARAVPDPVYVLAADSGITPQAPPLPFTHNAGALLFDRSPIPPDQNLTTLHRLDPTARWRLWSPASITPQITSYFRQYRGDITVTVVLSRVNGANDIEILSFRGIRVQYSSSSNVFIVLGDDNVGSTNTVIDFPGIGMPNGRTEPSSEVVPSGSIKIFTIRYNSFTETVDLFDGTTLVRLRVETPNQAANETRTTLRLADFGDFRNVLIVPACLSADQVAQMVSEFNPSGYLLTDLSRFQPGVLEPYRISAPPITPFRDSQVGEAIVNPPASATSASGKLFFAHRDGIDPSSVLLHLPKSGGGTMDYADNGSGALVAQAGAQAVSSSSIYYVNEPATGQIVLSLQPTDGDLITLVDGYGFTQTYEFESGGGVDVGHVPITIGADVAATATNLRTAINNDGFLDIAASGSAGTIDLAQVTTGASGNTTITETGANISKTDFSGGIDAGSWFLTITGGGLQFDTLSTGTADYDWLSAGINSVGALIPFDYIELPLNRLYLVSAQATSHLYADSLYIIKDGFEDETDLGMNDAFIDPQPVVVSVTADSTHRVTAVANAGPTNAGDVITWWEVELVSGDTEVVIVADYFQPNNFGINRNQTDQFDIPLGQDFNEKRIRFVVQAVTDASQIWRSLFFRMIGDEFDNAPETIVTITQPGTGTDVDTGDLITTEETAQLILAREATPVVFIEPQDDNSRYKLAPVFKARSRRGNELGFLPVLDDFYTIGSTYQTYTVRDGDIGFPDGIAVRFYGSGFEWAWWVIAYANAMIDPDQEMFAGQRLVIPPRTALQSFLARASITTLST